MRRDFPRAGGSGKVTRRLGSGKLVIATHNAGKLKEIGALLAPYGLDCLSAGSLGLPEPAETGKTFVENALLKARAATQASGLPALADDSGLSVAALGGRPGVYTADWAARQWFEGEPGRDWYMAMGKVEGMLQAIGPDAPREAWFSCVLALAWPDGEQVVYEGRVDGSLTWPPRGEMGFGYDPVFVPTGRALSFAEISPEQKHAISHRADAFAKLVADQFAP
jgi:XTP/dITP diphosphohydrolase